MYTGPECGEGGMLSCACDRWGGRGNPASGDTPAWNSRPPERVKNGNDVQRHALTYS